MTGVDTRKFYAHIQPRMEPPQRRNTTMTEDRFVGASPEAIRKEFGRRLQKALNERGWTQSELARRVAPLLPDMRVGRDNISKYVRGLVLPLPPMLEAICKVLGKEPSDLLPSRATRGVVAESPLSVRDAGDGRAWVEIKDFSKALPWPIALKLLALLQGQGDESKAA
jgi:transcriptional regulator with XRE-family HTH domain